MLFVQQGGEVLIVVVRSLWRETEAGRTMTTTTTTMAMTTKRATSNKGAPLKSGVFNNQHYAEVGEREATNDDDHYYDDAKTKTIRR